MAPLRRKVVPRGPRDLTLQVEGREVRLTNLDKPFWPERGLTKGDLLEYYARVSPWLVPHLLHRPIVMKRYPGGVNGPFFFMKRTPHPRPEWLRTCAVDHGSAGVIDFPLIDGPAALLWIINLGCIDLNPWYSRCDDTDRPDFLCFDLDPGSAPFAQVRQVALLLHDILDALALPAYVKTSGSKGLHVYVPVRRGPTQRQVWAVAKAIALEMEARHPRHVTAEYRVAKRPAGRVLVDYNQNAWGRTLASIYSVRPTPHASVSTPITWRELREGVEIADFRLDNVPARLGRRGDLWAGILAPEGRADLSPARWSAPRV